WRFSSSVDSRSASIIRLRAPGIDRINSSSLDWSALACRFWLVWITNTIQKVMMVVVVLITSCHVSLKRNIGPVSAQTAISRMDRASAHGVPSASVRASEISMNRSTSRRSSSLPLLWLDGRLDLALLRVAMLPPTGPMIPEAGILPPLGEATRVPICQELPQPRVVLVGKLEGHAPLNGRRVGDAAPKEPEPVVAEEHGERSFAGSTRRQRQVPRHAVCLLSAARRRQHRGGSGIDRSGQVPG